MKHLTLATLALALSSAAMADTVKQVVNGTCPADVKTIYIYYNTVGRTPNDSVKVNANGQFSTTINKDKNTLVTMQTDDYGIPFFVDGTPVTVDFIKDSVTGSELNTKLGAINNKIDTYNKPAVELYSQYAALKQKGVLTEAEKQQIEDYKTQLADINDKVDSTTKEAFNANKGTLIGAALLPQVMYDLDYRELSEALAADNEMTHHPLAEPAKKLLAGYAKRAPGTMYTDITENDVDGKPHKLSEWVGKGNYVMIDFWASWCGPCRAEMPNVVANYAKYHSKGFEIIGLSFDSKTEAWKKAINDLKMPWIHLSDLKGWKTIASSTYGVNAIPASVLIDPTGKIIAIDLRGDKLGNKLKEIYGE